MKELNRIAIGTGAGLICGLVAGFLLGEGTIKNANVFLRAGAEVSHVHFIDSEIIANERSLSVKMESNRYTQTRELGSSY